jgi:hypothetical protein
MSSCKNWFITRGIWSILSRVYFPIEDPTAGAMSSQALTPLTHQTGLRNIEVRAVNNKTKGLAK